MMLCISIASMQYDLSPYASLANYLLRNDRKNKDFIKYTLKDVEKAIKRLADGQKTIKSMDGASHLLNSALSEKSTSLTARFRKFEELELNHASKKIQKEASKVLEYVNVVERGLQGCEILQSMNISEISKRNEYLTYAGLTEIRRVILSYDKIKLTLSVLIPIPEDTSKPTTGRFANGEIVIALVDASSIDSVLRLCSQSIKEIKLNAIGRREETINVLPTVLELTMQAVEAISDLLIPISTTNNSVIEGNSNSSTTLPPILKSLSGSPIPQKVRILGHSVGGAVGAYLSMLLDGALSASLERAAPVAGLYHDRVRCLTFASPPCISRMIVPRFISSLICGDDIIR